MPQYIDFYLSENRYDKLLECLAQYCEKSDDYFEIEYVFYIIKDLTEQKERFFEKLREKYENSLNGV